MLEMTAMHGAPAASQHPSLRSRGFTLIELLVTLALAVVLMVVAVPSFVEFRRNADLSDAVSSFIMASGAAKSAALKTGMNAVVEVNVQAEGWRSGWFVYLDRNLNGVYNIGTDEVILERGALPLDIATTTPSATTLSAGYLMFSGSVFPRLRNGTLVPGGTLEMANPRRSSTILVDASGRVRSCKTLSAGCSLPP